MISHKSLFSKLQDTSLIAKCTTYAHWTLPQLMADMSITRGLTRALVERDYQEIGALLTNNLASKLARLLFPGHFSFFKIEASDDVKAEAEDSGKTTELMSKLSKLELRASQRVFKHASYAQLILLLKHLIVTGSAVLYRDSKASKCVVYGLHSFAIRRDGKGGILDLVIREYETYEALPLEIQKYLKSKVPGKYNRAEQIVEVYTRVHRKQGDAGNVYFEVTQEVDTTPVGEANTYPEHLCPYIAPTWSLISGEHYGRGLVEDFAGGFAKLSDLSEAATLYGIEMMRVLHLVAAGSGTDIDDIANAETGQYVRGDPATVSAHESGDGRKLQEVSSVIEQTTTRLSTAFMYQGPTRDAERVTMYELQRQAQEAEYSLGGAYSSLAEGIQVPLACLLMYEEDRNTLAALLSTDIKPQISAGLPALGRSADVQNALLAAQEAAALVSLSQIDSRFDPAKLVDLVLAGRSVDAKALQYDEETMEKLAKAENAEQTGMNQVTQAQADASTLEQLQSLTGGMPQ